MELVLWVLQTKHEIECIYTRFQNLLGFALFCFLLVVLGLNSGPRT
jgi:hypothetical protein